jgi:hypothetical protein
MQPRMLGLAGIVLVAAALAGCTGNFDVKQTEPLRIALEGAPAQVDLNDRDAREREIVLITPTATTTGPLVVKFDVTATQKSNTTPTIIIIVKDRDSGQTLARKDAVVSNTTATSLDVDIKGRDNVVVLTQVINGSAIVNVAAHKASATQATSDGGTSVSGGTNTTATGGTTVTSGGTNTTATGGTGTNATGTVTYP